MTPPGADWLRQGGSFPPSRTSGSETLYLTGWYGESRSSWSVVQAWLLGTDSRVSVRLAGASEEEAGPPKLLSLREETPELALPDKVELLPSRMDCGLVGEAGIGCRGDWRERDSQDMDMMEEHSHFKLLKTGQLDVDQETQVLLTCF